MVSNRLLERLVRARRKLRAHLLPASGLDSIAADAGLSRAHFIRQYARVFGETPHRTRMRARMQRARHLLVHSELPVTEVCFVVGHSSLGSFSAMFARHFGESPAALRRRLRGSPQCAVPQPLCVPLMNIAAASQHFSRSGT